MPYLRQVGTHARVEGPTISIGFTVNLLSGLWRPMRDL